MAFFAKDFAFDGIPSQTYGVFISGTDGGDVRTKGTNDVSIESQGIFRRAVPYFYGATQDSVLSFPAMISSPNEISADVSRAISRWLFGSLTHKKLQIFQGDMTQVYFNCFLKNPEIVRVGNTIRGYSFDVVCDAPWAWAYEKTLSKTYTGELASESYTFQNTSDDNDYLYPRFVITINGFGGDFSLTNTTDNSRIFSITDLSAGEILTVDNDRGILTSSTGLLRMPLFNKNWFRLLPSRNDLVLSGNISSLDMTYSLARKVG